jgi:hypothetical protein
MSERLASLLRTYEAEEERLLQEKSQIESVLSRRQQQVSQLRQERARLETEVKTHLGARRREALASGEGHLALACTNWGKRMARELEEVAEKQRVEEEDLTRAMERSHQAAQLLIEVRVEKKKIERLMEGRARVERQREAAVEEIVSEEIAQALRRRTEVG